MSRPEVGTRGDLLFVYGTLRHGFENPGRAILESHAEPAGVGRVLGALFDAGAFPVLVLEEEGSVVGELYELMEASLALERLDWYEGARGDRPAPYERSRCSVELVDGSLREAWVYAWRGSVEGFGPVPRGDYAAYRRLS